MAMFKVKVKMTTIGEGIIEGTDKATVIASLNANNIDWWALRVHQTTNSVVEEVVELEEKAGE